MQAWYISAVSCQFRGWAPVWGALFSVGGPNYPKEKESVPFQSRFYSFYFKMGQKNLEFSIKGRRLFTQAG